VFNGLFLIDELQVSDYYGGGAPSCNTLLLTYWLIWYRFLGININEQNPVESTLLLLRRSNKTGNVDVP